MDLLYLKLLASVLVFILILIPATLPLKVADWFVSRGEKGQWYMSIIACFGGGVFLGAYLIHLMPEVEHLIRVYLMEPQNIDYPISNTLCGMGFFLLLFVENLMHRLKALADQKELKQMEKKSTKKGGMPVSPTESENVEYHKSGQSNIAFEDAESHKRGRSMMYSDVIESENNTTKINFGLESSDDSLSKNNKTITPVEIVNGGLHLPTIQSQVSCDSVLSTAASDANLVEPVEPQSIGAMKAIVMFVALSADALFAGLSCGLQKTEAGVWNMVIAIVAHELVISFMLGLELVKNYKPKVAFWLDFAYALGNPLGIIIGLGIYQGLGDSDFFESLSGILQALCGGVFIYVTFMEILPHEYIGTNCPYRALAILCGFTFMALMKLIPHAHEHENHTDVLTTLADDVTSSHDVTSSYLVT